MKVIGITGKMGSGKDTVAKYLVKNKGYKSISISNFIRKEAKKSKLTLTRSNLSKISKKFTDKFGETYWSECALKTLNRMKGDKFVITGIRRLEDYDAIKSSVKAFKLYSLITAPALRFERIKERSRPGNPETYIRFKIQEEEELELYQNFEETMELSKSKIENNESLEELYQLLDKLF